MPATVVTSYQLPQASSSGLVNGDYRETFVYVVVLSEPDGSLGARTARDAAGIPAIGAALGSTGLVAMRKRAEPEGGDDSGLNYRVTVEYGIQDNESGTGSGEPWNRKDRIRRSVQAYEIVKSKDLDGESIENAAGDPLAGGLVFAQYNPVRTVNRYRLASAFNPETAEACIGTINDNAFTLNPRSGLVSVPAGAALLKNITTVDATWPSTGLFYYDITFEIELYKDDPNGYGQVPLEYYYVANRGWNYIDLQDGNAKKPYLISQTVGGETRYATSETFLNSAGEVAGAYDPALYDLQFRRAKRKSWAGWI